MKRKVVITLEAEDGSLDMLTNVEIFPPLQEEEAEGIENVAISIAGEIFDWLKEEAVAEDECVCAEEPLEEECQCGTKV